MRVAGGVAASSGPLDVMVGGVRPAVEGQRAAWKEGADKESESRPSSTSDGGPSAAAPTASAAAAVVAMLPLTKDVTAPAASVVTTTSAIALDDTPAECQLLSGCTTTSAIMSGGQAHVSSTEVRGALLSTNHHLSPYLTPLVTMLTVTRDLSIEVDVWSVSRAQVQVGDSVAAGSGPYDLTAGVRTAPEEHGTSKRAHHQPPRVATTAAAAALDETAGVPCSTTTPVIAAQVRSTHVCLLPYISPTLPQLGKPQTSSPATRHPCSDSREVAAPSTPSLNRSPHHSPTRQWCERDLSSGCSRYTRAHTGGRYGAGCERTHAVQRVESQRESRCALHGGSRHCSQCTLDQQ